MNYEDIKQLEQLILKEKEIRETFREKRKALEALVQPVTDHVKECCKFWSTHLGNTEEITVLMSNGDNLKIKKPTVELCTVESYLPFGMDFNECVVITVGNTAPNS